MKKTKILAIFLALLFHCSPVLVFAEEEEAEITGQGHISLSEEIDEKIEEEEDRIVTTNPSNTGDYSNSLYWYLGIFVTNIFFLILLLIKKKRKHN